MVQQNMNMIEAFRSFYRQHSDGLDTDKSLVEHQQNFVPFAQYLYDTMGKVESTPHVLELRSEIREMINKQRASPYWLVDMHFRFLALDGMSESERDLFNHTSYHQYLDALLAKDCSNNPVVVDPFKWNVSLDREKAYFFSWGEAEKYLPGVSQQAMNMIHKELVKYLPPSFIYPCLEEDIFSPKYLIQNWFKEIYAIGMPIKSVHGVHGEENASKIAFAYHDLFHFKNDKRRVSLYDNISSKVGEYVNSDQGFAEDIIPQLVHLMAQKYLVFMTMLEKVYLALENDRQAVTGFFTLVHEVSPFSPELFDISNPGEFVDALIQKGLQYYTEEEEVWENPSDPLMTSPLNGNSLLSDDEIRSLALAHLAEDATLNLPYQIYEKKDGNGKFMRYITDEIEKVEARKTYLLAKTRSKIVKSPQFIDVVVTFADGNQKTVTYPTLVRKWKNVNTTLGLLKYAGHKLVRPELSQPTLEENRKIAIEFVDIVRNHLTGTITHFGEKAKQFLQNESKGYQDQINNIDNKILNLIGNK